MRSDTRFAKASEFIVILYCTIKYCSSAETLGKWCLGVRYFERTKSDP
jgi:hypothetical protein